MQVQDGRGWKKIPEEEGKAIIAAYHLTNKLDCMRASAGVVSEAF
jgi:hypothetical protein